MLNNLIIWIAILLTSITGCQQARCPESLDPIPFKAASSMKSFSEAISSVKLIPIRCGQGPMLGSRLELIHLSGDYILCDMENSIISRYDTCGIFLNTIAERRNDPENVISLADATVQAVNDSVVVITGDGSVFYLNAEGSLLRKSRIIEPGLQSTIHNGGVLAYYGYTRAPGHRLSFLKDGEVKNFLPSQHKALPLLSSIPLMSRHGNRAFLIDSFNNTIYSFDGGDLIPYLSIDFGEYALASDYYNAPTPEEGAKILLGSSFAYPRRYIESDAVRLIEVVVQERPKAFLVYGMDIGGKWIWFGEGKDLGNNFFEDSPRILEGKKLIALIAPDKAPEAQEFFRPFIESHSAIQDPDSLNCLIAEITLK